MSNFFFNKHVIVFLSYSSFESKFRVRGIFSKHFFKGIKKNAQKKETQREWEKEDTYL